MLQLVWNFSAQLTGGPAVALAGKPEIGALDKLVVQVKNDGTPVTVDLQPADADKILMLVAQSSEAEAEVTVEITDGKTTPITTGPLKLNQPLLLAGAALALLKGPPLKAIVKFTKVSGPDRWATIELVVARKL